MQAAEDSASRKSPNRKVEFRHTIATETSTIALNGDKQAGDPLFDAIAARRYVGNISDMTLWRWRKSLGFPEEDLRIGHRRFWRLSTIEGWLAQAKARAA
jgi:hypothetical protein